MTECVAVGAAAVDGKQWFSRIRSQNVPVSGPMILAKALEFAAELGDSEFKASNGWLEKFRKRHDITFRSICGESSSVDMETVTSWKEKLPSLISGYSSENIFNADETGLVFPALPDITFKGQSCAGGKVAKGRLTVLLCASMSGECEKPLVIGKSLKPRCFKKMDVTKFGGDWKANRKAWMTREIMTEWLEQLDRKMMRQKRKVLLFLDNATSHTDIKLKNVKVILDEDGTSLQSLTKELNVFQAICWITNAWKQVSTTTIQSCFRKAGFPAGNGEMNVESDISDEVDTTQNLINSVGYTIGVNDYVCIDLDILTECSSADAKMILQSIQSIQENENGDDDNHDSDDDDDDVGGDVEIVKNSDVPTTVSYSGALDFVKRLKQFYSAREDENGLRMRTTLKDCRRLRCSTEGALEHFEGVKAKNGRNFLGTTYARGRKCDQSDHGIGRGRNGGRCKSAHSKELCHFTVLVESRRPSRLLFDDKAGEGR
ncbi:hypothetical protein ANN_14080 [Periplaneta americana]|uniref:HTH CENPB-type domain-containing protein n=1 Tax=Periplaneta americana TaxID=6978 RepID=A0ABQ8SWJ2_PERAM|nr:hypothetical protein ANN_14080 [Periplaneta americana]